MKIMRMGEIQSESPGNKSRTEVVLTAAVLIFASIFAGFALHFFNNPQLASEESWVAGPSESQNSEGTEFWIETPQVQPARLPLSLDNSKRIEINLQNQRMVIFENEKAIAEYPISTGKASTPTKKGNFSVISKYPMAYGGLGSQSWGMPFFMGIYKVRGQENGIHELPFINGRRESDRSLGRRLSHGCVRLGIGPAEKVYNWAEIGTEVVIR